METIPAHVFTAHALPLLRCAGLHALSAASRSLLQYLRETGAFAALDRDRLVPLNGGEGARGGEAPFGADVVAA